MARILDKPVRLIGALLFGTLWFSALVSVLVLTLEHGGLSTRISDAYFNPFERGPKLYTTDYYGKQLDFDPYDPFRVQHLHPYFLFSLPWREGDRLTANNAHVAVDESGFRQNPLLAGKNGKGLLLGGSTAFGHGSSSNETTIAAMLSRKSGIGFVNRNAPSWNSHQEVIALAKYRGDYMVSVSFTFANDVSIYCDQPHLSKQFPDEPESFDRLSRFFNDIRGPSLHDDKSEFSMGSIPAHIQTFFPKTKRLYEQIAKSLYGSLGSKAGNQAKGAWCKGQDPTPLVEAFLSNEKAMRLISEGRGAKHLTVLQPYYGLHRSSKLEYRTRSKEEYEFRSNAIDKIMASDFCRTYCYDYSRIYDTLGGASHIGENVGLNYRPQVFIDDVHFTDLGVELVTNQLTKIVLQFQH